VHLKLGASRRRRRHRCLSGSSVAGVIYWPDLPAADLRLRLSRWLLWRPLLLGRCCRNRIQRGQLTSAAVQPEHVAEPDALWHRVPLASAVLCRTEAKAESSGVSSGR
jgi:hypothetical protein